MEHIWASAATRVINDLEIVTYGIEEHSEMKPAYPVSKQKRPVFINSNHSEEGWTRSWSGHSSDVPPANSTSA